MSQEQQKPSPRDDWYRIVAQLAFDCADMPASEEVRLLRALHRQLANAPIAAALKLGRVPPEPAFEGLLAAGACETAVLQLIGSLCGYMISRGPGGLYFASVVLPGQSEETSAGGETFALALAGALALALAENEVVSASESDTDRRPALRFN